MMAIHDFFAVWVDESAFENLYFSRELDASYVIAFPTASMAIAFQRLFFVLLTQSTYERNRHETYHPVVLRFDSRERIPFHGVFRE